MLRMSEARRFIAIKKAVYIEQIKLTTLRGLLQQIDMFASTFAMHMQQIEIIQPNL